jgi:[protein-PII] uridylyltransferase
MPAPFYSALFAKPDPKSEFRTLIASNANRLRKKFDPQKSVSGLIKERSDFIDQILKCIWQNFLGDYAQKFLLCAVGGYGRRELFPHSDIDIAIILTEEDMRDYTDALGNFSVFLWDIGLKPAQSVRTIRESVDAARNDQTILTSLMEIHLIDGCEQLLEQLKCEIAPEKIWPSDAFFFAKMEEQRLRYAKYHDTAYNLEPNIKEGPGGLRDRQVIAWVFKRHYNSSTLKELIKYGFLPLSEYRELVAALDVLWRIRYALHLLTNSHEDRLVFDYQRDLANQFGFTTGQPESNKDVEQFMQFYFETVLGLERLNEMLLQLFNERFVCGEDGCEAIVINDNFFAINNCIEIRDNSVFEQQPLVLLEIFLILAQNPELKGIRSSTIRLIRKNLSLIDDEFRTNKAANRLFLDILRQPQGISHQLKLMNRYGVLGAYMPDFANIIARMQYDLFHIYTVDEHTLFVIANLRRFSLEKHCDELPFCNDIFLLIAKPEILYIAAFFHDIAKGKNGDHSVIGEKVAKEFCIQHQLSGHDTRLIIWLVRNHLIMSTTAQRRDIGDPDVIHAFALKVGSTEYLNHLYLLTVADIRATNPEIWSDWKDSLLKELYLSTHTALRRGLQNPVAVEEKTHENRNEAREELLKLGIVAPIIDSSWQHVSDDYFLRYTPDEIVWHTIAIAESSESDLPLVLLRPKTQHGSAEVFVYTKNEGSIFSICTGTLDQLGLTILDARIITTMDNYVFNSFQVLEQDGKPINELFREARICTVLHHNLLVGEIKKTQNIQRQTKLNQAKHFPIRSRIEFHTDPHNRYSIMELITTDHAGLLSKVGTAFIDQEIDLHNAKITTIGGRAEDMFYITDINQCVISDVEKQNKIREHILGILEVNE